LSCLSGSFAVGTVLPANMYSMVINAIIYATAPTLGDIRDIVGDSKIGAKTLPVIYGPKRARFKFHARRVSILMAKSTNL
jgi:4-hydroxybenzoate polyprenyltransferase